MPDDDDDDDDDDNDDDDDDDDVTIYFAACHQRVSSKDPDQVRSKLPNWKDKCILLLDSIRAMENCMVSNLCTPYALQHYQG